jgi:hypothetical protein
VQAKLAVLCVFAPLREPNFLWQQAISRKDAKAQRIAKAKQGSEV